MDKPFSFRIFIFVLAIIGIVVAAAFLFRPLSATSSASRKTVDLTNFHLDLATTDAERELGLGGRNTMADDEGMLFVFDKPGIYPFWMKGMQFSLDLIWLNGDRVVDVATLPPPASGDVIPATHTPLHLADKVLEINAGTAKALGIEPGVGILFAK